MDKMREEFELSCVSFKDEFGLPLPIVKDKEGCYISQITDRAWYFWQASRKALVVELPITVCRTHVFEIPYTHEVGMEHDEYFEVDDIHKALDAAGVAYK